MSNFNVTKYVGAVAPKKIQLSSNICQILLNETVGWDIF